MKLARQLAIILFLFAGATAIHAESPATALRPPAVPLVTSDPYLSIWSEADHLTDDTTRHWTRRAHSLVSLIRVDGKAYRLMGKEPEGVAALPQVALKVWPTRTVYDFEGAGVHVTFTFMSPCCLTILRCWLDR